MNDFSEYFGIPPYEEPDYGEELPETEGWRYEFRDGSSIIIIDFEDPKVEIPHRRSTLMWDAEKAKQYIDEEQMDYHDSIEYVKTLEQ